MKKFILHIVSIIICLGFFADAGKATLSLLTEDYPVEIAEKEGEEVESLKLEEALVQEQRQVLLNVSIFKPFNYRSLDQKVTYSNPFSNAAYNKLFVVHESYLL